MTPSQISAMESLKASVSAYRDCAAFAERLLKNAPDEVKASRDGLWTGFKMALTAVSEGNFSKAALLESMIAAAAAARTEGWA